MKISSDKLSAHLGDKLAPAYLVSGDEHLLAGEAADAIRARAAEDGFGERRLFLAQRGFDWHELRAGRTEMSLFATHRLLELRIPTGKPGDAGSKAIGEYVDAAPADCVLLVITPKLDRAAQNSKWVKTLERFGVWVQVWPVDEKRLPQWVRGRMRDAGLLPDNDAVQMLADRVEGNLLAAQQEIEKLRLLNGPGAVDAEVVRRAVADSARFDVFSLTDAALAGETARATRILGGLRSEGQEPVLILWALSREIRVLAGLAFELERGRRMEAALASARTWRNRAPLLKAALMRHKKHQLHDLLLLAGRVDRVIKGLAPGRVWDELAGLVVGLSGVRVV